MGLINVVPSQRALDFLTFCMFRRRSKISDQCSSGGMLP